MIFYLFMAAVTYGVIIGFDIGGGRQAYILGAFLWAVFWPICWGWVAIKIIRKRRAVA